jgi:hypothetical protein
MKRTRRTLSAVVNATVNMLIQRINAIFGLSLPTLPLTGWPAVMNNLWQMFLAGPLPDPADPLPWTIEVSGSLEGLLPPSSTLPVRACILVGHTDTCGSPNHPI